MTLMMLMSMWMQMRQYLLGVQVYQCIFGCQGLLDEGDSAMEDGEIDSKVSVHVMFGVYCLVQVDAEDSVVTITEETPTKIGDKVSIYISLNYICWLLQEEKCFCAKSDKCPTIGESDGSVSPDTNKVCGSFLLCFIVCYYVLFLQDSVNDVGKTKDLSSGDCVSPKNTKVCGVLLCQ